MMTASHCHDFDAAPKITIIRVLLTLLVKAKRKVQPCDACDRSMPMRYRRCLYSDREKLYTSAFDAV